MNHWSLLVIIVITAKCSSEISYSELGISEWELDTVVPGEPLNPDDCSVEKGGRDLFAPFDGPDNSAELIQDDIIEDGLQVRNVVFNNRRWPNGIIPYEIDVTFEATQRSLLCQAMALYHQLTCIRFKPRTTEKDFVFIHNTSNPICASSVGWNGNGRQFINLNARGCFSGGASKILLHEMMHTAGFTHEQNRPDRDCYVQINFDNMDPKVAYNFNICNWTRCQTLNTPYDYNSIMHYDQYAFAIDKKIPTITYLNPDVIVGNRDRLNENDILRLNRLYECQTMERRLNPQSLELLMKCRDLHRNCKQFQSEGSCGDGNANWMAINCRKTCGFCAGECVDINPKCPEWAQNGSCTDMSPYMTLVCPKSCILCGADAPCNTDIASNCQQLAGASGCERMPDYMAVYCRKSCSVQFCKKTVNSTGCDGCPLEPVIKFFEIVTKHIRKYT